MADHSRRRVLAIGAGAAAASLFRATSVRAAPLWVDERQVGPFIIHSTFALDEYRQLFAELPKLQRDLRATLAIAPAKEPIYVHLLDDRRQHEAYVRERFPNVPYRRALFVRHSNQLSVFAYRQSELATDLRHECTHALLHSDLVNLPLWLDEGLAEYFETPAELRVSGSPHFSELELNVRLGIVVDVPSLETRNKLEELSALDYRYAWAWSHFLLHGPVAAHRELGAFLTDLRRGKPAGNLSDRLAVATPKPEQQLVRHFRRWSGNR